MPPLPAGNTSTRATELPAGETITGSIQTDSLALVDLYKSLDGMGWSHSNNWNSSRPVATWAGVQVSDVDRRTSCHRPLPRRQQAPWHPA